MQPPIGQRSFDDSTVGRKHGAQEEEEEDDGWKFVSSMTFASSSLGSAARPRPCDCDECECGPTPSRQRRQRLERSGSNEDGDIALDEGDGNKGSFIPDAIRRAIEQHKKQKRLRVSLQQTRTLRARHWCENNPPPPSASADTEDHDEKEEAKEEELRRGSDKGMQSALPSPPTLAEAMSAWEWELPLNADPSVEFGASHRVVWVRRCPGMLKSIAASVGGAAMVVGSSDEESRRVRLEDWTAGSVVFVPGNGGHAVGYVHVNPTSTSTATTASLSSFDADISATDDQGGSNTQQAASEQAEAAGPGSLYATLLVVKLPDRLLKSRQPINPQLPSWLAPILPICRRLIVEDEPIPTSHDERGAGLEPKPRYMVLNAEEAPIIKAALSSLLEASE